MSAINPAPPSARRKRSCLEVLQDQVMESLNTLSQAARVETSLLIKEKVETFNEEALLPLERLISRSLKIKNDSSKKALGFYRWVLELVGTAFLNEDFFTKMIQQMPRNLITCDEPTFAIFLMQVEAMRAGETFDLHQKNNYILRDNTPAKRILWLKRMIVHTGPDEMNITDQVGRIRYLLLFNDHVKTGKDKHGLRLNTDHILYVLGYTSYEAFREGTSQSLNETRPTLKALRASARNCAEDLFTRDKPRRLTLPSPLGGSTQTQENPVKDLSQTPKLAPPAVDENAKDSKEMRQRLQRLYELAESPIEADLVRNAAYLPTELYKWIDFLIQIGPREPAFYVPIVSIIKVMNGKKEWSAKYCNLFINAFSNFDGFSDIKDHAYLVTVMGFIEKWLQIDPKDCRASSKFIAYYKKLYAIHFAQSKCNAQFHPLDVLHYLEGRFHLGFDFSNSNVICLSHPYSHSEFSEEYEKVFSSDAYVDSERSHLQNLSSHKDWLRVVENHPVYKQEHEQASLTYYQQKKNLMRLSGQSKEDLDTQLAIAKQSYHASIDAITVKILQESES